MTLLYYHDDYLAHDTGTHPENASRIRKTISHLKRPSRNGQTLWDQCEICDVPLASSSDIARAHHDDYVARIEDKAADGGGWVETDTVISRDSYRAASRAVGASLSAVRRVVDSDSPLNALCLVRPPGHHALYSAPMGFCLFNNIAIAAKFAVQEMQLNRVLIVDWDVHHGNGTQDCFWWNGQVGFFSVHRYPFYPGTGAADETGTADGLGLNKNLPMAAGVSRSDYQRQVIGELGRFADKVRPDLVLLSAGFDTHRLDPVGSLGLETEDFQPLTQIVTDIANTHCRGRLVSLLEGGYNTEVLPECVAVHLQQLLHP